MALCFKIHEFHVRTSKILERLIVVVNRWRQDLLETFRNLVVSDHVRAVRVAGAGDLVDNVSAVGAVDHVAVGDGVGGVGAEQLCDSHTQNSNRQVPWCQPIPRKFPKIF
jgi:hypothetical protein